MTFLECRKKFTIASTVLGKFVSSKCFECLWLTHEWDENIAELTRWVAIDLLWYNACFITKTIEVRILLG